MSTSFALSKKRLLPKVYVSQSVVGGEEEKPSRPHSVILDHHFNRRLDITIPTQAYESKFAKSPLFNGEACAREWKYYHCTTSLASFIHPEFLNQFVKKNNCLVLSLTKIDTENVYCIYDGKLRLSLRKEAYESAGLQGKRSQFSKTRYNVELNLRSPLLLPGNKTFDRLVFSCNETLLKDPVQFLFCVFPTAATASSPLPPIPEHLHATPYPYSFDSLPLGTVCVPSLQPQQLAHSMTKFLTSSKKDELRQYQEETLNEGLAHIFEWTSLLSLQSPRVVLGDDINPLLSSYEVFTDDPEESPRADQASLVRIEGMITSGVVHKMFKNLIINLPEDKWAVLTVYGFDDSPVSWRSEEHSYLLSGENGYTIVIKPCERSAGVSERGVLVFEHVCSHDMHSQ
ncbi:ribonuclease P 40kDa subunit-domain-containing protein [Myxozyma melibiosi]|uniref:Ribonuclease P 40kDa subunit-domain-containing protein n=1 Tax=Myxozyma melibiosi TaxID=54550 RepID=A0ABR1EZI0_9ASCO